MPQEKEIVYCPAGHSGYTFNNISIFRGECNSCTIEHFSREFGNWSSENVEIDKFIQESQINNGYDRNDQYKLQWIQYDKFQDIKHIADGGHGSVHSAMLKNGIKWYWNFNKQHWEYCYADNKFALKEINDSRNDISEFLKEIKNIMIVKHFHYITKCIGISKNPSSENYIIVMELYDDSLHKFITKNFMNLRWKTKIDLLYDIVIGLGRLHTEKLVHRDLHSGNILTNDYSHLNLYAASITDLGLCSLVSELILLSDKKSNNIYGSIPYIPPEVLRGSAFTKEGDIYSFGGIMYEIATGKRPFYDRAHDTRLIIDICNGLRPKIPDIMLNWMPQCYSDFMYKCWNDDPSERPTDNELRDTFWDLVDKFNNEIEDYILQQFKIADENQEKTIKSQKQESSLSSSISHPQSCYISRSIHTLHGLYNSLDDIKSGKSQDPNLLKSNESITSSVSIYDIDPKESQECIDWEKEIQNKAEKRPFSGISTLDCNSREFNECINLDNEDNIAFKKIKKTKKDNNIYVREPSSQSSYTFSQNDFVFWKSIYPRSHRIHRLISYIPSEALRGNEFTKREIFIVLVELCMKWQLENDHENQEKEIKSQKQESSLSSKPQECFHWEQRSSK
ncbi:hypothetical protein Glove_311g24 [Diversispora epigaea]|uniref:Protein kinase domain-containing protein n=1 Tax=Diversispora epigaea TaxID=1348612 RepID=A0A397HUV2_9GLOM|nr:hypothetical protein Glove_311g24 [Diversispora epigaea]